MIIKAIENRRSIRKYTSEPVEKAQIEEIIKAGQFAPTAKNNRLVEFVVIEDRETREKLAAILNQEFVQEFMTQAPVLILPVTSVTNEKWAYLDLAIASENMLLQATELGLGSVFKYINSRYFPAVRELLGIPENFFFINLVVVGYPAESKAPHKEADFEPKKIHWGKW